MVSQYGSPSNKPSLFNGKNYALYKIRMRTYLMSLGVEFWQVVLDGYKTPTTHPIEDGGKKKI